MMTSPSKALVIRINLIFLAFFLVVYATLLLRPSSTVYHENAASLVRFSLRECHHKVRWAASSIFQLYLPNLTSSCFQELNKICFLDHPFVYIWFFLECRCIWREINVDIEYRLYVDTWGISTYFCFILSLTVSR